MTDTPKRFIAGVVCPSCSKMDKIVMYRQDGVAMRECVNCGYQDKMQENARQELPTRVSGKNSPPPQAAQQIKFYPPPKKD